MPLCLYILRDLNRKLDYFSPRRHILVRRMSVPPAFGEMKVIEFISKIQPLFPSLRRHLNSAVSGVRAGITAGFVQCLAKRKMPNLDILHRVYADTEICPDHWKTHSAFAGNPDIPNITIFRPSVSRFVIKETLQCFGKVKHFGPNLRLYKTKTKRNGLEEGGGGG